jgi:hypothetical protein
LCAETSPASDNFFWWGRLIDVIDVGPDERDLIKDDFVKLVLEYL